jgi:D-tyrosyl-tRNA(Tyr) deacylase
MRLVLQRVSGAEVEVGGTTVGKIGRGILVFVGVGADDTRSLLGPLADKVVNLRIFGDAEGKTNLSLLDVGGEALVVSQFTLYADCRKGRRPSFTSAGDPEVARALVQGFRDALERSGVRCASGEFGAYMKVSLLNDGPFTIVLDSDEVLPARMP